MEKELIGARCADQYCYGRINDKVKCSVCGQVYENQEEHSNAMFIASVKSFERAKRAIHSI